MTYPFIVSLKTLPLLVAIGWRLPAMKFMPMTALFLAPSASFQLDLDFTRRLKKVGVERRVYTAGERKMSLDPFAPEQPEEIVRLKALQKDIHQAFRSLVENRRGDKITEAGDMLFTGEFWSGAKGG